MEKNIGKVFNIFPLKDFLIFWDETFQSKALKVSYFFPK